MADETRNIDLNFQSNANQVKGDVDNLNQSVNNTVDSTKNQTKAVEANSNAFKSNSNAVLENGGAMGLLNDLTGGYAMMVKDAVEASALFTSKKKVDTVVTGAQTAATVSSNTATQQGIIAKVKDIATTISATVAKGATTVATNVATAAQWLWNAAVLANPLVALVVALVAAGAAIFAFTKYLIDSSAANEAAAKNTAKNIKALEAQSVAAARAGEKLRIYNEQQYALAEAAGASSEELRKLRIKHVEEEIALNKSNATLAVNTFIRERNTLATLKAAGASDEVIAAQDKLTKSAYKELQEQNTLLDKSYKERASIRNKNEVEIVKENTARIEEREKKRKEEAKKASDDAAKALQDQKNLLTGIEKKYALDISNLNAKTEQEKLDEQKRQAQAELDAINLNNSKKIKAQQLLDEKFLILQTDLNDKIKADNLAKLDELLLSRELKEKEFNEIKNVKDIEALRIKNQNEIIEQQANDVIKAVNLGASEEQIAQIKAFYNEKRTENDKQAAEATKRIDELTVEGKMKAVTAIGETLKTASTLLGKNTAASKALAIAGTTVDTLQSSISAYKGMVAAIPGPVGIAAGAIAAAASVATGFATIKKITAVQIPGGGGGGGSAPSAPVIPASAAPNVSFVASSENQIAGSIARQTTEQPPVKAYVVSSEVSTAQSLDRNLVSSVSI